MLGKRPMKRTTSVKEFALDLNFSGEEVLDFTGGRCIPTNGIDHRLFLTTDVSSINHPWNFVDSIESDQLMGCCSLCKRRFIPGHDIYMYRGDSFCRLECRQRQIIHDKRKERYSLAT